MAKQARAKGGTAVGSGNVAANHTSAIAATATTDDNSGSGVAGLIAFGLAVTYLCAFASLWTQLPGLYFADGLLPVDGLLRRVEPAQGIASRDGLVQVFSSLPSLLWVFKHFGLHSDVALELTVVLGVAISALACLQPWARCKIVFAVLWLLYFSVYKVGQTFLHFQWDILLLEVGILAMFLAPWWHSKHLQASTTRRADRSIGLFLIKWLAFRLMFASGIVKLTSWCPTWWNLTALDWHFESQCIPTPAAWFAHQLPSWMKRFGVASTYVVLVGMPALFFVPVPRQVARFGALGTLFLQVLILSTGNYNFFNLLTMVLIVAALRDGDLCWLVPSGLRSAFGFANKPASQSPSSTMARVFGPLANLALICGVGVVFAVLFGADVEWDGDDNVWGLPSLHTHVGFSKQEFLWFTYHGTLAAMVLGTVALVGSIATSLWSGFKQRSVILVSQTVLAATVATALFAASLVPLSYLHEDVGAHLPTAVRQIHAALDPFEVTHSYGLFRRMTGVGGRPEVSVEWTEDDGETWHEIEFKYKPNALDNPLPAIAPHQPRLDWQMWFAALGRYEHNPWLVQLCIKLMAGSEAVRRLLPPQPPGLARATAMRMRLWKYHFTNTSSPNKDQWWWRESNGVYMTELNPSRQAAWISRFQDHYGFSSARGLESCDGLCWVLSRLRAGVEAAGDAVCPAWGADVFLPVGFAAGVVGWVVLLLADCCGVSGRRTA